MQSLLKRNLTSLVKRPAMFTPLMTRPAPLAAQLPQMAVFSTLQSETFAQRLEKINKEALMGGGQARIDK